MCSLVSRYHDDDLYDKNLCISTHYLCYDENESIQHIVNLSTFLSAAYKQTNCLPSMLKL